MKVRTDRETARLDISYIGTYIGGAFVPSAEVVEARFCSLQNLPPHPQRSAVPYRKGFGAAQAFFCKGFSV
jgi:hypothetical protein